MRRIRSQGITRPKISTMPRNQSEASNQLELYKLITEKQRIKQELVFIEQRKVLLTKDLSTLQSQIDATDKNIKHLRGSELRVPPVARPKIFFETNNYKAFDIEY
ncbi:MULTISPECIES: gas vesicle protein [unclassified Nostoc]|uniref:Gas vesicle protein n=1 Tax=Nostoc punctiforme NIES-2108 TaxID=1356359 RepID=A0A367RGK1_NOSPU|nr:MULTISPECIES: gas vesicle protein [unclassified Nostoc]MBN3875782.1 gas vesicle protein [Nostoc sp. JL23]MBN3892378.1 gas vesicle protein [Nostoc sp. JL31]RCJ34502.1 gas vesicle protein [Nostoc punctiforme NIES-2108]